MCGDYRVDSSNEECDAGPDGDVCCTRQCMLTPGANCRYVYQFLPLFVSLPSLLSLPHAILPSPPFHYSDSNSACCEMCDRTDTLVCRAVRSISTDCTNNTVCRYPLMTACHLPVCPAVCLSTCLSVHIIIVCLSTCLSVHQSVCPCIVCLSICLSVHLSSSLCAHLFLVYLFTVCMSSFCVEKTLENISGLHPAFFHLH